MYYGILPQLHSPAMTPTVVWQCDLQLEVQIMQNDVTKWHWPPATVLATVLATEPSPRPG